MTLTEFVLARTAEREAKARAAAPLFSAIIGPEQLNAHLRLNAPAAVLARCAVDRQIVEFADEVTVMGDRIESEWGSSTPAEDAGDVLLRLLASLDADHPDYDESWKP